MRFRIDDAIYISVNDANFLENAIYTYSRGAILYGLIGALAVVIFLLIISVLKPWGKRKKDND
ncbi:hypothetical protein GGQ84_000960 [Desulfitispora alkaliphila]|uniref:hypothetical protein n=1 Tax=Desulfitispora alkaliphila TaxID=622674 RepID=UPI003D1941FE